MTTSIRPHIDECFEAMASILLVLDQGDLLPLAATAVVLLWIAHRLADGPQQRTARICAAAGFLAYLVFRCWREPPAAAGDLLDIVLRATLAAALLCGLLAIAQPVAVSIHRASLGAFLERLRVLRVKLRQKWAIRAAERDRRRNERAERRSAPQRRRAAQEAEQRAARLSDAQRRREDARAECEFLYTLYAPEIRARFPRKQFEAFLGKYLGDDHPPEYVEQRAQQLRKVLDDHHGHVEPQKICTTFAELAAWFEGKKQEIETASLDEECKARLQVELELRYDTLMRTMIQELSP